MVDEDAPSAKLVQLGGKLFDRDEPEGDPAVPRETKAGVMSADQAPPTLPAEATNVVRIRDLPLAIVDAPPDAPDAERRGGGGGEDGSRPTWCSDDALAKELSDALGNDWISAMPGALWHRWSGTRWERDTTQAVLYLARMVCRRIAGKCDNAKLARAVSSKSAIYAAARLAGEDRKHAVPLGIFDRDDWLLNTPANVIDLRTAQARPHRRDDYMARSTRVAPEGECPLFKAFLREAAGHDEALIKFVQRCFGYCLTGLTSEHAIFFLEGPGGTGKTILLNILSWILGDYATTAGMDLFTVATGERHTAGLAVLEGARLVTASETEEGRRFDEAKIKAITGGDPISANRMRQDPVTFVPKFKLFMAGNYRPAMRSADDAMRRRFHIIPWKVKPARPDKQLPDKLQREAGGILKFAIEGAVMWQREGLAPPPAVVRATDDYFEAENVMGRWIAERCVKGPEEKATIKELFADFRSWAMATGEYVGTERRFAQRLDHAGFERGREPGTGQRRFHGIAPLVHQGELDQAAGTASRARVVGVQAAFDDPDEWERGGPRE